MNQLDLRIVGRRRGFTLVEMLVVLALMLVLAALAIAFVPRMNERAKTPRGASQLQMWLLIARQWAKRDNIPTGIRLQAGRLYPNPATANINLVTDIQYIQQPPPYHALTYTGSAPSLTQVDSSLELFPATAGVYPPGYSATNQNQMLKAIYASPSTNVVDFYGGNLRGAVLTPTPGPPTTLAANQSLWQVQPGDYLEMPTGGKIFLITDVIPDPSDPLLPLNPNQPPERPGSVLFLSQNHGLTGTTTQSDYRIIRGPRILSGEKGLQLPQDVAIDTTTNTIFGNTLPTNTFTNDVDILFAPSGQVISKGLSTDKIILWVRDVTQDGQVLLPGVGTGPGPSGLPAGEHSLVVVHTRTGFIASHNVFSGVTTLGQTAVTAATVGTSVQITVANAGGISVGDYLIIDANSNGPPQTFQETQQVINIAGNTLTFGQMMFSHTPPYRVVSDPYSYVRSAHGSGI